MAEEHDRNTGARNPSNVPDTDLDVQSGPSELPDVPPEALGTSDVTRESATEYRGGTTPTAAQIDAALRRSEAQQPDMQFIPAAQGDAPMHIGATPQGAYAVDYRDDESRERGEDKNRELREAIGESLSVAALVANWVRLWNDRRGRPELDRQLDALGYPPNEYTRDRSFVKVHPDRQAVYDSLAGVRG